MTQITVLQSLSPPDGTTRYVNQVVEGAPDAVTMRFFSWRTALLGRYDVFHVHWPELLIRAPRPLKARLRRGALYALLVRARLQRIPIVRTMHNLAPHEVGHNAETRALNALDARTALVIRLNPTTPVEPEARAVTILHGHYRDRFSGIPLPNSVPGRILYFGLIRPYKGVETLMRVFRSLPDPDLRLRLVGRPSSGLGEIITVEAARDARISSVLRFVSDAELVVEVGGAELVVLPYREMHNSGVLLVTLSLDRPVLVPSTPSNLALAEEVGADWIYLYDGELTPEILHGTLERMRAAGPRPRPRLDDRDWTTLGLQSYRTYLRALQLTGRTVRAGRSRR
ncbi:glycosyl transferase [Cryobacterium sp. PH29-G1]|uniref:glycosyl transferase n=1 Tax=Cryobacterium sp. PH29-G1 TaxID=3046211 RepID=UPI0024BB23DE|nr:glycosyl transferase [Cryobacterium sp. PH29-G1]MDJ0347979.1 glycosyl transferase [Cryobacterium sp. PH29-G1]